MRTLLITVAKDEDDYLDEWIAFHLKLGFSKIVVVQNEWRYKVGKFANDKCVEFRVNDEKWDPHFFQAGCFNCVKNELEDDFDYIAAWDVDEFLMVREGMTFHDFLHSIEENPSTLVRWRIFGDSNLSGKGNVDRSVVGRFIMCGAELEKNGKSIVSMGACGKYVKWFNPHFTSWGDTETIVRTYTKDAELFHYRNKTIEERMDRDNAKSTNGDPHYLNGIESQRNYFRQYNKNDVVNTRARDFLYGKAK